MKIEFYIPYSKMKENRNVKTLKECDAIYAEQIHPVLDGCSGKVWVCTTWDDDGKHRIGRFYSIKDVNGSAVETIVDTVGDIAEEIALYA